MTQQTPEPEVDENADTFPREYVERLRAEAAEHRTARKAAEEVLEPLQRRLFGALVEGTGRLADPTDLAFDAALFEGDALTAAIDGLIEAKPHLASRRVRDDVGQGAGEPKTEFSLAGMLGATA